MSPMVIDDEVEQVIRREDRESNKARRERIRTRIVADRAREAERKASEAKAEAGRQAEAKTRAEFPVICTLTCGGLTVTLTLANPELVRRHTAEAAIERVVRACTNHVDLMAGDARAAAMKANFKPAARSWDRLFAEIQDLTHAANRFGAVSVTREDK